MKAFMIKEGGMGGCSVVNCTLTFALQTAEHSGNPQSIKLVSVHKQASTVERNLLSDRRTNCIKFQTSHLQICDAWRENAPLFESPRKRNGSVVTTLSNVC